MSSYRSSEVNVEDIKPYWRNPRKISDEAVDAVRMSLEQFGYLQPIVVDEDNVIIIGHTRYSAMWRLGVQKVDVMDAKDLTPEQVKQLRVVDNQTHVYADWDYEKLLEELEASNIDSFLADIFPEAKAAGIIEADRTFTVEDPKLNKSNVNEAEFICPSCFHEWTRTLTKKQALSGFIGVED